MRARIFWRYKTFRRITNRLHLIYRATVCYLSSARLARFMVTLRLKSQTYCFQFKMLICSRSRWGYFLLFRHGQAAMVLFSFTTAFVFLRKHFSILVSRVFFSSLTLFCLQSPSLSSFSFFSFFLLPRVTLILDLSFTSAPSALAYRCLLLYGNEPCERRLLLHEMLYSMSRYI